jgi:integrase
MAVKVRERKGAWWLFVDHKGRRKAKRVGVGPQAKKAAYSAAEKIQAKLALGDASVFEETRTPARTLREHSDNWLKTYVAVHLKPGTEEKYRAIMDKHWLLSLGRTPVASLHRDDIKRTLGEKLAGGLKASTACGLLNVLRACLTADVEDRVISANPASRLGKFAARSGDTSAVVDPFTREELSTLLEAAERQMPEAYPLVLTLARAGLRIGEALTLRAEDLDFRRRELWVRRTWGSRRKALGDRRINPPKSNKARRVDMSEQLCRVLGSCLTLRQAEAVVQGKEPAPWLFVGSDGGPMTPGAFWQNVWRPLLRRAEIRYRKPHALRHTFASLLLANKESPAYVKEQMGHSSIKITVDSYGHLIPGANKAAVDRLDDATGSNLYATDEAARVSDQEGREA